MLAVEAMSNAAAVAASARIRRREAEARTEDLAWMTETGESLTGAARRLGVSARTLESWCRRHGHLDLFHTLAGRERDPNLDWGNQHERVVSISDTDVRRWRRH